MWEGLNYRAIRFKISSMGSPPIPPGFDNGGVAATVGVKRAFILEVAAVAAAAAVVAAAREDPGGGN